MVLTVPQALAQVSQYAVDTRSKLNTTTTQRRNAIYNSFGQERSITLTANVPGLLYLPVTTDISNFIRWNFKLVIRPLAGVTVNPTFTKFNITFDGLDVTSLFESQWSLPRTVGIYPNKSMGDFYDIIKICEMLSDLDRDTMLNGGMHVLQIETDASIEVTLLEFVSYSFISRHGQTVNDYPRSDMPGPADPGPIGGGGDVYEEPIEPTFRTMALKSDLDLEQQTLEQQLDTLSGSRASQFIEAATINTRLAEIETEKQQIEQLEELQNGGKQIIE